MNHYEQYLVLCYPSFFWEVELETASAKKFGTKLISRFVCCMQQVSDRILSLIKKMWNISCKQMLKKLNLSKW